MMDDQDPQVELVERVSLNPHEMIIPTNLEKRLSKLRKIGFSLKTKNILPICSEDIKQNAKRPKKSRLNNG